MKRRLALNTVSNVGTLFLKLGITFIMTPLLVSNLGRYDYGLWEMVMAIIGYMGILDMGIRPAVSRYAAMAIARDDKEQLSKIYATAWGYLMGVGFFLALILLLWGTMFPEVLAESPQSSTDRYTLLLLILSAQLLIVFPSYTAESFLEAYQQYYLKNNITILNSVLGSLVVYHFITPENALVLLAGVNAAGIGSKYIFYTCYLHHQRNFLRIKRQNFSLEKLKELFGFSLKTFVQGVSTRVENATDSLVIGVFLGPAIVPIYSIPANLVNYIRSITYNLTHVLMPYFSTLLSNGEINKTRWVYILGSKVTVCAVLVMAVGVLTLGETFLSIWIGPDIAEGASPIIWILVAFTCLPLLNPYASRFLTAINRHGILAKLGPIAAISNLLLSILLVKPMGIYGVALGSLLPAILYHPYILSVCCRELGIPISQYFRKSLLPCVLPTLAMITALQVMIRWGDVGSYQNLIFCAALSVAVFLLVASFLTFSKSERAVFYGIFVKQ